jgi:hypothetical protein
VKVTEDRGFKGRITDANPGGDDKWTFTITARMGPEYEAKGLIGKDVDINIVTGDVKGSLGQ